MPAIVTSVRKDVSFIVRADPRPEAGVGFSTVGVFSPLTLPFHNLELHLFFPHREADSDGHTNLFFELTCFKKYTKPKEISFITCIIFKSIRIGNDRESVLLCLQVCLGKLWSSA